MGQRPRPPKLVPDAVYPGMWRVQWPDGRLSDMTNLARAQDTAACFIETEERHQRGAAEAIRRSAVRQNAMAGAVANEHQHGEAGGELMLPPAGGEFG